MCTTNDVNSDCFIHALKFHLLIQYKDLLRLYDQCKISMQDIFVHHDGLQGQRKQIVTPEYLANVTWGGGGGG